jgi:hypothetical protein
LIWATGFDEAMKPLSCLWATGFDLCHPMVIGFDLGGPWAMGFDKAMNPLSCLWATKLISAILQR